MASIKDLQDQMNKNSAAWHGASQAEKDRLHQENIKLQQQISSMGGGSSSFNSSTGKWTTTGGSSGGGSTGSSNNSGGASKPSGSTSYPTGNWSTGNNGYGSSYGTDANGQTDYSVLIRDAMNNGADWQTVQNLLNQRVNKAQQNGYNQYMYDDLYNQAQNYISANKNGLYQDYMDKVGSYYDDIQAQQQAAQQAAVDQAVNQLTGQKTGIEQSYDDLYRQLYLDRRRAEKNLPQQMAAMGITGGLAEGTALGIQTDYTDALRQGEIEKLATLNNIDQAITDAQLTGDIGIAQQAAQLAMDKLATYGSLISQMQDQQNWANNFAWQQQQADIANDQWQQQWNRQQMLDQLSRDDVSYDRKLQLAQYLYENTGDASGFRQLGFTDAQIAALQNSYAMAMQQAMKGSSGGGSRGSSSSGVSDGYGGGIGGVDSGYTGGNAGTPTTNSAITSDPFGMALGAVGTVLDRLGSGEASGSGMNPANFGAALRSIAVQLESGKPESVISGIDGMWPNLSNEQKQQLTELLYRYGYQYEG